MGFLFEAENNTRIMVDPYLLNNLEQVKGPLFHREVEIREEFIQTPDVIILTHSHDDHTDFATLDRLLTGEKKPYVLGPESVQRLLRERYGAAAEWVLFRPGTEYTINGISFSAVEAEHSDTCAIGVVIMADGRRICHLGDTLFNHRVVSAVPLHLDLLIVPINGKGNNMNAFDASRFTKLVKPGIVLPAHWDMFKAYGSNPDEFTSQFGPSCATSVFLPEHYSWFDI